MEFLLANLDNRGLLETKEIWVACCSTKGPIVQQTEISLCIRKLRGLSLEWKDGRIEWSMCPTFWLLTGYLRDWLLCHLTQSTDRVGMFQKLEDC